MALRDTFTERIATILADQGALEHKDISALQKAFSESAHENFEYFLLDEGIVDKESLLTALSEYYQVPSFDVEGYFFEHPLLLMFPKDVLLRNNMIPLEQDENILVLVVSDPSNDDLLSIAGEFVSYDIRFFVGLARDIQDAVKEFYDESLTEPGHDDQDLREERDLARQERMIEENEQDIPMSQSQEEEEVDVISAEDDITK
jgi:hypothetical protein